MIETKYGLKYSFPHTIVHINDNSDHTIVPENAVAEDPSLYSTIVVTGAPMGEDNRVVNITNTDILTTAYGMYSLTASDIQKYGQSVEYAQSLVSQGAPVKMLRVTPPGSTYGLSTILVQWKVDEDAKKFIVRFKEANPEDYENKYAIYLSRYQNPARLNRAVCNVYNNPDFYQKDPTDEGWETRVFINNISAGRGADYNNMITFINKIQQPRRAGDTRYEFGTIDTRSNSLVESFIASLINDASIVNRWNLVSPVDTVNINVAKREEGSSIIVPFVNEEAIREVYAAYIDFITNLHNTADPVYMASEALYDAIFDKLNINTFDIIYGKYIYDTGRDDVELNLPMYQVDMFDSDIPRLTASHQIKISIDQAKSNYSASSLTPPALSEDWPTWLIENAVLEQISNNIVGVTDNSDSAHLGDVYLVTPKSSPAYFSIVTEINQYTGNVVTKSIPKVYKIDGTGNIVTIDGAKVSTNIKAVYKSDKVINSQPVAVANNASTFLADYRMKLEVGDVVVITGNYNYTNRDGNYNYNTYMLFAITSKTDSGVVATPYKRNIYYYLDYTSFYAGETAINNCMLRQSVITASNPKPDNYTKIGTLYVDDTVADEVSVKYVQSLHMSTTDDVFEPHMEAVHIHNTPPYTIELAFCIKCRTGEIPSVIAVNGDNVINNEYDLMIANTTEQYTPHTAATVDELEGWPTGYYTKSGETYTAVGSGATFDAETTYYTKETVMDEPDWIYRTVVTTATTSTFRVKKSSVHIPNNYYSDDYGASLYSEAGGTRINKGSTGFFDTDMNSIEFKWNYSALLTRAFKGQIDPRILSPVRVPAKYLFDAAYNTIAGLTQIPLTDPEVKDVIFASSVFTDDDREDVQNNPKLIADISYEDIDVKQAMYDLMIERNYQRIPEDKRPVGPGSGLSLHLDAGYGDINTIKILNQSFERRFTNPNASWDIGGYTDANTGVTYTFTKRLVDNLVRHCKTYTVNKPYVGKYTAMQKSEYTSIFPDVDATDWDLRELLYQSGGNSWVADTNGVVTRRSQRTLMRDSATSDLLQESNMRTLSQLVYLLQNKLDTFLLEYDDDGVLKTMSDECNTMFSGWVGSRVQSLSIRFERDTNIDGRDIVVCYVDVTFRGLVLSIPIIVNVNRRNRS